MEYNEEFNILFERSMLYQLFDAYRYEFEGYELIDDIYSKVRIYNPETDPVHFVYKSRSDYNRLLKYVYKKLRQKEKIAV